MTNITPPGPLQLRLPRLHEEAEFQRARHEATPDTPTFLHYHDEGMPFADYLQRLREQAQGINLPSPRHVPSSFLFGFDADGHIVGRVSIRHHLNAWLAQYGGHIGYAVVPRFRRRGYATRLLAQALQIARDDLGIRRALLTCDDDNTGSIKVIERNGGVLENRVVEPGSGVCKRRYWIER